MTNRTIGWSDDHYNWITRNKLRFGRCTSIDNVCAVAAASKDTAEEARELRSSWERCADAEASEVGLSRKGNRSKLLVVRREGAKVGPKRRNNGSRLVHVHQGGGGRRVKS